MVIQRLPKNKLYFLLQVTEAMVSTCIQASTSVLHIKREAVRKGGGRGETMGDRQRERETDRERENECQRDLHESTISFCQEYYGYSPSY